jgi:hypothetical protein
MRLTLLRAKEALRHRSPDDKLEYRINRCCERLILNGDFVGSRHDLRLSVLNGLTVLPQNYRTVEAVIDEGQDYVLEIANQMYQFLPGHRAALATGCNLEILRDLGDGHATLYGTIYDGTLGMDYTGTDDHPVTIYGTDADGMPVIVTLTNKADAPTANPFHHIDRIHKEQGDVSVRVFQTAADTTVTNLAWMNPTTEESFYRRYAIDTYVGTASATILVLAKLRHIEFTSEQDVLPFTNISALESMMDSLQYRAENDITLADRYEADAVSILNMELGDVNSNNSYPVIKFVYPGGTTPKFTSHY